MAEAGNTSSPRFPTLDGLRAVAVGIVILSHLAHSAGAPPWLVPVARAISGEIGVLIFFTISGFIISHLLLREHTRQGRINLCGFWYRRALRILPPLIVLLAVLQMLGIAGWLAIDPASQWASLFFVRNHVRGEWFNGHLWSLSVEEQFYLGWPLVMVWALAGGRVPPFRWLVLGTIASRTILAWRGHLELTSYGLIGNMDALMLGCWGAWHFAGKSAWPQGFFDKLARHWPLMLVLIVLVSFVKSSRFALAAQSIEPALVGSVTISLILAHLHPNDSVLFRALNGEWISKVGRMSYSLYLWQQLFLCPLGAWEKSPAWLVVVPVNLMCAAVMGYFSYRWVELTALRCRSQ